MRLVTFFLFCTLYIACSTEEKTALDDAAFDDNDQSGQTDGDDNDLIADDATDDIMPDDGGTPDDDTAPATTCGNGIEEGLEGCDTLPVSCTDLGSGWKSGDAQCREDCKTYDINTCQTDIPAYGTLNGTFTTPFVFDDSKLGDSSYLNAHTDGITTSVPFSGTFAGNKDIPNVEGQKTISYALRNVKKDWMYVIQETLAKDVDNNTVYKNPHFELHFTGSDIVADDFQPNMMVMGATRLYVFNYSEDGAMRCLLGIGVGGTITVSEAVDLPEADGGKLSFEVKDVSLYYIKETPYGQKLVENFKGITLCEKE